jgi:dihydropyrimidinase
MWDLVVTNGTLVIPESGLVVADVAIQDGRVVAIGRDLGRAREEVDAHGCHVFPGLVDPHVHLGLENSFADDARTETASALAGGVTTVGLYLRELEDSYAKSLLRFKGEYEAGAFADAFFSLQLFNYKQLDDLGSYVDFGVTSFKMYMYGLPGVVPSVDDAFILEAMLRVASIPGGVVSIHCENEPIVEAAIHRLRERKPEGDLSDWAESHPDEAEAEAIGRAAFLAERAGCTLYVVHLSSELGLQAARHARRWYPNVVLETTSPILGADKTDPIGLLAKMSPPLRAPSDREALWHAIAEGTIDTVGTDNTSRSRSGKKAESGLHSSITGYPALGTHLAALIEEGYHQRNVPLETLARIGCQAPAQVFGVYPRKGTIAIGSEADIVIVDVDFERVVDPRHLHSFSDFSIFEGRVMRGWPRTVIKGGQVGVAENEILLSAGSGRYLPRGTVATAEV